ARPQCGPCRRDHRRHDHAARQPGNSNPHPTVRRIFFARAYTLLASRRRACPILEETQAKRMKRRHESLQKCDAAAWDEVYEEHARELYGFAFRLVRCDPQTAADVFQDTWLDAIG